MSGAANCSQRFEIISGVDEEATLEQRGATISGRDRVRFVSAICFARAFSRLSIGQISRVDRRYGLIFSRSIPAHLEAVRCTRNETETSVYTSRTSLESIDAQLHVRMEVCVTSFRLASMTSPMRWIGLCIGPSRSIIRLPMDAGVCLSLSS